MNKTSTRSFLINLWLRRYNLENLEPIYLFNFFTRGRSHGKLKVP